MSNLSAINSQTIQGSSIASALDMSSVSATTNCNSNLSIGTTSTYTTPAIGTFTIGTNSNWGCYGNTTDYNYSIFKDTTMENLFLYLKEEEISEIFNKIIERESESEKIKNIISRVVRIRHFTEEFLLEYIPYMDMSDITMMHNADIKSGGYPNIALMIEGLK